MRDRLLVEYIVEFGPVKTPLSFIRQIPERSETKMALLLSVIATALGGVAAALLFVRPVSAFLKAD